MYSGYLIYKRLLRGRRIGSVRIIQKYRATKKYVDLSLSGILVNCCWNGHFSLVRECIAMGADPLLYPILHNTCSRGYLNIAKYLIHIGCALDTKSRLADMEIMVASSYGHLHIVNFLVKIGCNPIDTWSILYASQNGHLSVVKYLYKLGCDPTMEFNFAIRQASYNGHLPVVKYLYKKGCDPFGCNEEAIIIANKKSHKDVVDFLLSLRPADAIHMSNLKNNR